MRSRAAQRLHWIFDTSAVPARPRGTASCTFSLPLPTAPPSVPFLSPVGAATSSVLAWMTLLIASEALAVYLLMPSRIVSGAISNETESDPEEVEEEEGEEVEPEVEDWGLEFGCSDAEGDGICLTVSSEQGCGYAALPATLFLPTRTCRLFGYKDVGNA